MKIPFREIANRITGFSLSTPVVGAGLSWNPPVQEVEIARRLLAYLADRRALYNPYNSETGDYVVRSIIDIRKQLTDELMKIDNASFLSNSIIAMRAACREFLDRVENSDDVMMSRHHRVWDRFDQDFFMALGELRSRLGISIAQIAVRYQIDVEENLESIFPPKPESSDAQ